MGVSDPESQIPSARARYRLAIKIAGRGLYREPMGWFQYVDYGGGMPQCRDQAGVGVSDPESQIPSACTWYRLAIEIAGQVL